jgi:hypothetical protein
MDITILYYTANVENELFEQRIRDNILASKGELPLVSVSQKPLNFGYNICVGRHEPCYINEFRQIQIGLKEIKTKYVLTAEADTLYPPDYFRFVPTVEGKYYRYNNVWVSYYKNENDTNPKYYFKGFSDGSQLIDRDLWLEILDKLFKGKKFWNTKDTRLDKVYGKTRRNDTWGGYPVVTFKTKNNISANTKLEKIVPRFNLEYWGNIKNLRRRMFY